MFIATVIGFVAFFILLLVFVAIMDMEELGFIMASVGAVFVGIAWYADGPSEPTAEVNATAITQDSNRTKAVLEENTLLKGRIDLLKGRILECETRRVEVQRIEPDPYGTGY